MASQSAPVPDRDPVLADQVCLLGGPYVRGPQCTLTVPEGSKRLLVFVALHGGRVDRRHAAGSLWPDGDDERASGNLRSALWRLKGAGIDVLEADKVTLAMRPGTRVDVDQLYAWSERIIDGSAKPDDLRVAPQTLEAIDLLPGWYDEWVIFARERLRQRLLHALEALSRSLRRLGRCSEAVEVAMVTVGMEPLRESAQVVLAEAHLAEGNLVEVLRCYRGYQRLLDAELGVAPGVQLQQLIERAALARRPRAREPGVEPAPGRPPETVRAAWPSGARSTPGVRQPEPTSP